MELEGGAVGEEALPTNAEAGGASSPAAKKIKMGVPPSSQRSGKLSELNEVYRKAPPAEHADSPEEDIEVETSDKEDSTLKTCIGDMKPTTPKSSKGRGGKTVAKIDRAKMNERGGSKAEEVDEKTDKAGGGLKVKLGGGKKGEDRIDKTKSTKTSKKMAKEDSASRTPKAAKITGDSSGKEGGGKTPKPSKKRIKKPAKDGVDETPSKDSAKITKRASLNSPKAVNEGGAAKSAKKGGGKSQLTAREEVGKTPKHSKHENGSTPAKGGSRKTLKTAKKLPPLAAGDGEENGEKRKASKSATSSSGTKRKAPENTKSSTELHCRSPAATAANEAVASTKQLRPIERVGTVEEECARMKPGSIRSILYQMLTEAGAEGMSVNQLVRVSTERKLRDWGDTKPKSLIMSVLCKDPLFVRIRYGVYSTAYLFPDGVPEEATHRNRNKANRDKTLPADEAEDGQTTLWKAKKPRTMDARILPTANATVAPPALTAAAPTDIAEIPQENKPALDPLTAVKLEDEKARRQLECATKAHSEAEARLAKLETELKAEEARVRAANPGKRSKPEAYLEEMPSFEVTDEQKEFKGCSDDRKALLAHRRHVQELLHKAEQDKLAWIREQKNKMAKAKQDQRRAVEELGKERRKAQQTLSNATREMEAAQKLCAAVGASLQRELAKASKTEEKQREKEERERKRLAEREERERKRLEALDAKRYPIDDMQLQGELRAKGETLSEVALPEFSSQEDGQQLARLLFVSDVTQRFCKELDVRPITMEALEAALSGKIVTDSGKKAVSGELTGFELVSQLYQGLLATILEDEVGTGLGVRIERRWASLLSPGTWPEVLRRYILLSHRAAEEEEGAVQLVCDEVARSARELSRRAPEEMTPAQHLLLLEALCNEALGTVELRAALARRLEEADEVLKDLRAARAGDRKQIREVEEALKEERKRKREEMAREAAARAEALAAASAAAAAAEGGANGDASVPAAVALPVVRLEDSKADEEEPSWELGPEFAEFTGASDDRKGLLEWRQKVNAERQRLEKEKLRWHAEKRRREKEREKALRAEMEAQQAKQRELERLQEELEDKQEAYERELNKYIVRQTPLGTDRYFRRYWWGMGAARGVVYVEAEGGEWAAITRPEELEALFSSLDKRGVREAELQENIDKNYQIICKAMKRAAWEVEKAKKAEVKTATVPERVLPRRAGSAKSKAEETAAVQRAGKPGLVEEEALGESTAWLEELASVAEEAGAQLPRLRSFGKLRAEVESAREAGVGATAYSTLVRLLSEVEEALFALSGQTESEDEDGEDEDEEEEKEGAGSGRVHRSRSNVSLASSSGPGARKQRETEAEEKEEEAGEEVHEYVHSDEEGEDASGRELWRTGRRKTWLYAHIKERIAWKASLEGGTRLAAAAYNTGVLLEAARGMTEALAGAKRKAEVEARDENKRRR